MWGRIKRNVAVDLSNFGSGILGCAEYGKVGTVTGNNTGDDSLQIYYVTLCSVLGVYKYYRDGTPVDEMSQYNIGLHLFHFRE